MQRRTLLSMCATLTAGGCLGLDQPQKARIAWIWLQNDRDEACEVDLLVEDAGETVLSETYEIGTEPDNANVNLEKPVDGYGQYVVRATMDEETREVDITGLVNGDEDCIGVRFSLLNNGSVDYWTKSMQQC